MAFFLINNKKEGDEFYHKAMNGDDCRYFVCRCEIDVNLIVKLMFISGVECYSTENNLPGWIFFFVICTSFFNTALRSHLRYSIQISEGITGVAISR